REQKRPDDLKFVVIHYEKFYKFYQADLGHYFRTLYHIFKFVKTSDIRSEEHTSELQSRFDLVCRLLLEKKKKKINNKIKKKNQKKKQITTKITNLLYKQISQYTFNNSYINALFNNTRLELQHLTAQMSN